MMSEYKSVCGTLKIDDITYEVYVDTQAVIRAIKLCQLAGGDGKAQLHGVPLQVVPKRDIPNNVTALVR